MSKIFSKSTFKIKAIINEDYYSELNLLPNENHHLLSVQPKELQIKYLSFLARKIRLNPQNLKLHTQRIQLAFDLNLEEAYFGALVDLFIVLGKKGLPLKKAVLRRTYRLLSKEHKAIIKQHLHSGLRADQALFSKESRLIKGASTEAKNIIKNHSKKPSSFQINAQQLPLTETQQFNRLQEQTIETVNLKDSFNNLSSQLDEWSITPEKDQTPTTGSKIA